MDYFPRTVKILLPTFLLSLSSPPPPNLLLPPTITTKKTQSFSAYSSRPSRRSCLRDTILRDTMDVLVVTAKGSSAEIIPFLKTWVNLSMAVGFMLLYARLSDVLSKEALFYSVIFPFIAFFGAFEFVLYPLSSTIHPTVLADRLLAVLRPSFLGPVSILSIWSFCLFYVMAELWGSVVVSVLFWGFANQVHRLGCLDTHLRT